MLLFGKPRVDKTKEKLDQKDAYERQLKSEFGVDYGAGGWGVQGAAVIDDMKSQLSDADICMGVLQGLRDKGLAFDKVCLVMSSRMVVLVSNTKPSPTCFVTGMNTGETGGFVAAALKRGGKCDVHQNAPWIITL